MEYNLEVFIDQAKEVASVREMKDGLTREEYLEKLADSVGYLSVREGGVQRLYQKHAEEIEYIKSQIKKMNEYKKILEEGQEKITELVVETYDKLGILPKSPKFAPLRAAKTPGKLVITDDSKVPFAYWKEVTKVVIDNEMVKEDIKAGKEVPGAEIVKGISIRGLK